MTLSHSDQTEVLRTRDLTLATYLIAICGYKYHIVEAGETARGHKLGAWEFGHTADQVNLAEKITEFENHQVRVEPQQFYDGLKRVRRELFDRLGIAPPPR